MNEYIVEKIFLGLISITFIVVLGLILLFIFALVTGQIESNAEKQLREYSEFEQICLIQERTKEECLLIWGNNSD